MDYVIDTTFLVRLWRERQRSAEHGFVTRHADDSVLMPWVDEGRTCVERHPGPW